MNHTVYRYYFQLIDFNGATALVEVDRPDAKAGRFSHCYSSPLPIDLTQIDGGLEAGGGLVLLGTDSEVFAAELAFDNANVGDDVVVHSVRTISNANRYDPTAPFPSISSPDERRLITG